MKKYYISTMEGMSGISMYSRDFYQLVLKPRGYIFVDSREDLMAILSRITSKDHVHIEIGIFQKKEIEILQTMIRVKYKDIAVTLHDAPLLKYPFSEFRHPLLNKISKFSDIHLTKFLSARRLVSKIRTIYVLTRMGVDIVKKTYRVDNVFYLPHIVDQKDLRRDHGIQRNLMYLGFIGPNKNIEYALNLHQQLLRTFPGTEFYVVGKALGGQEKYLAHLKEKYTRHVHFMGYVPEEKIDEIFRKASLSLQPFKPYRFFTPFSGSILYSLKKGNIVFTNNVNAVSEMIEEGKNGFYLSGDINKDIATVSRVIKDETLANEVKDRIYDYLKSNHSADVTGIALHD